MNLRGLTALDQVNGSEGGMKEDSEVPDDSFLGQIHDSGERGKQYFLEMFLYS